MSHVVCLVEDQQSEIRVTWSDGIGAFDGYSLAGVPLTKFREHAAECRNQLEEMVRAYIKCVEATTETDRRERDEDLRQTCFSLAGAGHKLYERLFAPAKKKEADIVREWLEWLRDQNQVEALELVLGDEKDGDPGVPWTVVYDKPPQQEAFLSGDDPERWRPFWGLRYNLAAGKRIDPLRRALAPEAPTVRLVVDEDVMADLGEGEEKLLRAFAAEHDCGDFITTEGQLKECLSRGRPSVLYWLSHASPAALLLGGKDVTPEHLYELLEDSVSDAPGQFPGLVFLNACQTGMQKAPGSSFLLALYQARCCGLIATEHSTVDTFASPLGLEFLKSFLDRGESVGEALRGLRLGKKLGGGNNVDEAWVGGMPMGLVYASFCPPHIRKARPVGTAQPTITQPQPQPGVELIRGGTPPAYPSPSSSPPLPKHPYRSLSYFDRDDRALFAGREGDLLRFARILDESATRVLVLHGESGCGKSSFLRAGVIPFLEEECVGYRFVRDRSEGEGPSPLFIRATNDLAGQIADALVKFCGQPLSLKPPRGLPVKIDLPAVLGEWRDVPGLRQALLADAALLGRMLADLGQLLPFTPVLVIDQAEEVFTLAREKGDEAIREASLEILRQAAETVGKFKVVAALRTEYYGRFVNGLRRGVRPAYGVREYLLSDFNEAQLSEAILRPTKFFGFRYAEGVAERLARRIVEECRNRQDSVLPLAQVICTQLYDPVSDRSAADRVIGQNDIDRLGGVTGGMKQHVDKLLTRHLPRDADQEAFRKLLTQLYHTQPDGTLTTELVPITQAGDLGSVQRYWTGTIPLEEMVEVMTRSDVRLLRKNTLRLGGGEQRHYISLGHDALAPVAAEWTKQQEQMAAEHEQKTRRRKKNWILGAVSVVALVMTGLAVYGTIEACIAGRETSKAKQQKAAAEIAKEAAEKAKVAAEKAEARAWQQAYNALMGQIQVAESRSEIDRVKKLLEDARPLPGQEYRVGHEWFYWWKLSRKSMAVIPECTSISFSEDGKSFASGDKKGGITFWDAPTGQLQSSIKGHSHSVSALAYSPDGKTLFSCDERGGALLWDLATLQAQPLPNPDSGKIAAPVFLRDGKALAAMCEDKDKVIELVLWNLEVGPAKLLHPNERSARATSFKFLEDGHTVAYWGADETVRIWNLQSGGKLMTFPMKSTGQYQIRDISPDGTTVASCDGKTIRIQEMETGKCKRTFQHTLKREILQSAIDIDIVKGISFSPTGKIVASWGIDGNVVLTDVESGVQCTLPEAARIECKKQISLRDIVGTSFSADGRFIVSAYLDGEVALWEVESKKKVRTFQCSLVDVSGAFLSPDAKVIAIRMVDGSGLLSVASLQESILSPDCPVLNVNSAALAPDSDRFILGDENGVVTLCDAMSMKAIRT